MEDKTKRLIYLLSTTIRLYEDLSINIDKFCSEYCDKYSYECDDCPLKNYDSIINIKEELEGIQSEKI